MPLDNDFEDDEAELEDLSPEELRELEGEAEETAEEAAESAGDEGAPGGPLYRLRLDYSLDRLYAEPPGFPLEPGCQVIAAIPARTGKPRNERRAPRRNGWDAAGRGGRDGRDKKNTHDDLARVLGLSARHAGAGGGSVISIIRKATDADLQSAEANRGREPGAAKIFREKAYAYGLEMNLVCAHYVFDGSKVLFLFTTPDNDRVNFIDLREDLLRTLGTAVELVQIREREEARITGALGVCGRALCCNAVSERLKPGTIRMAKAQNISLSSTKLPGRCGKLLCCLAYEYDWYAEVRETMPHEGARVRDSEGELFRVSAVNAVSGTVHLKGRDDRIMEVRAERLARRNGEWVMQD